jgi:hypothetical protein
VEGIVKQKQLADSITLTETEQRAIGRVVQEALGLTETHMVQIARRFQEQVQLQEVFHALFVPSGGFIEIIQVLSELYGQPTAAAEAYAAPGALAETFAASS